jgi:hypothetical protein
MVKLGSTLIFLYAKGGVFYIIFLYAEGGVFYIFMVWTLFKYLNLVFFSVLLRKKRGKALFIHTYVIYNQLPFYKVSWVNIRLHTGNLAIR